MAIRDRVTVVTRDGRSVSLEVAKQGGEVIVSWPDRGNAWLSAYILDKNGNRTREEMRVAEGEIVSIYIDTAPRPEAGRRKRSAA